MNFTRTHRSKISLALLVATLAAGLGFKAYEARADEDCCVPGAPCCHPGAPCCARHHRAGPAT